MFQAPYVGAVVQRGGAATPRRGFDAWQEWAKQRGAKGLAYVTIARRRHPRRPGGQEHLRRPSAPGSPPRSVREPGDAVFFAAGARKHAQELLGATRLEIGRRGRI